MTCSIKLGHCQDIGQGIVACIDIKGQSIKVFMEFLYHSPLEGKQLQFMGRVVRFCLCQAPTGVGDDNIHTIIMNLVEDIPQARPTSIGMEFKRSGEVGIGKNRCCGAQVLWVIKGPLTPVIPCDGSILLVCILTRGQLVQGFNYLHNL